MTSGPGAWRLNETLTAGRENLDENHVRRYDSKEDAHVVEELALLASLGVVGPDSCVVDFGAGTGQFTMAAAAQYRRVVAVDVSPVMLARVRAKISEAQVGNVEIVQAGFLSYAHRDGAADAVYSRLALHHLPDFWKAMAVARIADMLQPGGVFRLSDVVYSFNAQEADARIQSWISSATATDVESGWTQAELAEHVREEHSTFSWLLEPMIERAGFDISEATYSSDQMFAAYVCTKK